LWAITNELRQKLDARFELHPEPSTKDLQEYSNADGTVTGLLNAFSGAEIDWLVHSWLRNPQQNFNTMRLTTWLKPHICVPHLAFEFGTIGRIFFYMDYVPRTDLRTDIDYLERYYEPVNQTFLQLQANQNLSLFTSKSLYIRQFQSPISLCYTCPVTEESLELVRTVANEMLDRWLIWVNEAEPVPEDTRETLAERDLFLRRTSAERDPGNQMAVRMFGEELTHKLICGLWGGER
jgi:Red chlorophyll catabolite reductase (RCC reductase)